MCVTYQGIRLVKRLIAPSAHPYPFFFILLFLWTVIPAGAAHGGTISMTTRMDVSVSNQQVDVTLTAINQGNETAHDVQASLTLFGKTHESRIVAQMAVDAPATFRFTASTAGIAEGRYPLTAIVDFHDANHYPFSALTGMAFQLGPGTDPMVDGQPLETSIPQLGRPGPLKIEVRNLADTERHITAHLVVPRELSADGDRVRFTLPAKGTETITFRVRNFTAQPGATYPVACFLEYDAAGRHHTALVQPVVTIVRDENWFQQTFWAWVTAAGLLLIAIVWVQFAKRPGAIGRPEERQARPS